LDISLQVSRTSHQMKTGGFFGFFKETLVVCLLFIASTSVGGKWSEPCSLNNENCKNCLSNKNCGVFLSFPDEENPEEQIQCLTGHAEGPYFVEKKPSSIWFFAGIALDDQPTPQQLTQFSLLVNECEQSLNATEDIYTDDEDDDDNEIEEELEQELEQEQEQELELAQELEQEQEQELEQALEQEQEENARKDKEEQDVSNLIDDKTETGTARIPTHIRTTNRAMMGAEVVMVAAVVLLMIAFGTINAGKILVRKFRPD